MRNLKGKVAFVTGGASGIGLGIAEALLDRGVQVTIADLREDHLRDARERLARYPDLSAVALDVIDREAFAAAAAHMEERFGGCDILVNNAGVGVNPREDAVCYEDWDWVLAVNLGGVVNGIMSFLPGMLRRGAGHIVSTSSMAGLLPTANNYIYAASKYAVRGLSDSLRLTVASRGIGVSVLFPGLTQSRMLQSAENRQLQFRTDAPVSVPEGGPIAMPEDAGMSARDVGEAVVDGILANRGYIISHAEFRDEIAAHFETILSACPPPQAIDPGRLMLEEARRRETAEAERAVAALTERAE